MRTNKLLFAISGVAPYRSAGIISRFKAILHLLNFSNLEVAAWNHLGLSCIVLFYPNHCGVGVLAAVLLPRATALVLGSDTADTVAFVSHFPGDL